MVEGSGLENRRAGNRTRGSNPFSSANINYLAGWASGVAGERATQNDPKRPQHSARNLHAVEPPGYGCLDLIIAAVVSDITLGCGDILVREPPRHDADGNASVDRFARECASQVMDDGTRRVTGVSGLLTAIATGTPIAFGGSRQGPQRASRPRQVPARSFQRAGFLSRVEGKLTYFRSNVSSHKPVPRCGDLPSVDRPRVSFHEQQSDPTRRRVPCRETASPRGLSFQLRFRGQIMTKLEDVP